MAARNTTLSKNKPLYGWGINDSDRPTQRLPYTDGDGVFHPKWTCPIYASWKGMVQRVHDPKCLAKNPCYEAVSIYPEWKYFSKFEEWVITQDYTGKELDKDIIGDGFLYSPDTCCFVSVRINCFLVGSKIKKALPLGVTWESDRKKYKAEIAADGKSKRLGNFNNMWQAHLVYCKKKLELAHLRIAECSLEPRIANALINKLQIQVDNAEVLFAKSLKEK